MLLLTNMNFILLFIVFITRTNILTNQQFINLVNNRRTVIFPINSTFKKHQTYLTFSTKLSRKRRQSNNEFQIDSLKHFTCALVSTLFEIFLNSKIKFFQVRHSNKNEVTSAFIPSILILTIVLILVESIRFLPLILPTRKQYLLLRQQTISVSISSYD
jgi:hypothetical protein